MIQEQVYRRFSIAERDSRWAKVRALMRRDGLAVIVAPHNPGNNTAWQADARYLSQCGGGGDASIAAVFPLEGEVTAIATSAEERWGPSIQNWVTDVREARRRYGKIIVERLHELGITKEKVGITGLGGGTRSPEGTIMHGTYKAIAEAFPQATFVDASELLLEAREVKSEEEIAVLKRSVDLIEKGIEAWTHAAQPGVPDYVVWSECMHAMFSRGSEGSVHYNWVTAQNPGRTLTRPTGRPLVKGDVTISEIEASVVGYRAQQIRMVAVRDCNPILKDMSKIHGELYPRLLELFQPGITVGELIEQTIEVGKKVAMRSGPLADVNASLIVHGRGLGDDRPLLLTSLDARPSYEATERAMTHRFPESGAYIFKPTLSTRDQAHQLILGDTVHLKAGGAQRMGKHPLELVIAEPSSFANWPQDVTVYTP